MARGTATFKAPDHNPRKYLITTNLSFLPKLIFCQVYFKNQWQSELYYKFTVDSEKNDAKNPIVSNGDGLSGSFVNSTITSSSFKLELDADSSGDFKVDWIAIG